MKSFSLFELTSSIRRTFDKFFDNYYWVRAETSGVNRSISMQACYFDLLEKEEDSGKIRAKVPAVIWSQRAPIIIKKFEAATQQKFESGLNVLVLVKVRYHEQYGFSLDVIDIDPSHTLGGMVLRRIETINKLKKEGLLECQKKLFLPSLLRHIAVVSSSTAAGYGDFKRHIEENTYAYPFLLHLFPAIVQGEKAEVSIIEALEKIKESAIPFDCVVIIRGGGAVTDLLAFDSYSIAATIARYPIPIISGIGHDRDFSVVDMVVHLCQKTPTAVADFLIQRRKHESDKVEDLSNSIRQSLGRMLDRHSMLLDKIYLFLPQLIYKETSKERQRLQQKEQHLRRFTQGKVAEDKQKIALVRQTLSSMLPYKRMRCQEELLQIQAELPTLLNRYFSDENKRLEHLESLQKLLSPQNTLKRGYSIIRKEGKSVQDSESILRGDEVEILFAKGTRKAKITD